MTHSEKGKYYMETLKKHTENLIISEEVWTYKMVWERDRVFTRAMAGWMTWQISKSGFFQCQYSSSHDGLHTVENTQCAGLKIKWPSKSKHIHPSIMVSNEMKQTTWCVLIAKHLISSSSLIWNKFQRINIGGILIFTLFHEDREKKNRVTSKTIFRSSQSKFVPQRNI